MSRDERVWVALDQDERGYPPWQEEWLWAERVTSENYRVLSSPTFARGLSAFDVVRTMDWEDRPFAVEVIESSGHSTIRVVLFREAAHDDLLRLCGDHGCEADHTEIPGLFAIDVPPSVSVEALREALYERADVGDWDVDDAHISAAPGGERE